MGGSHWDLRSKKNLLLSCTAPPGPKQLWGPDDVPPKQPWPRVQSVVGTGAWPFLPKVGLIIMGNLFSRASHGAG